MLLTFTGQVNLNHGLAARGRLGMSLNRRDIRMSDSTADQPAHEPRKLSDLAFALAFGAAAVLSKIVWFAAIGWIAWQPIRFLIACIFD